jgi:phosphatidylglycerophosphatase A
MNRLALFIATCGYVGYVPIAPGTFGSAVGLVLLWAVRSVGTTPLETVVIVALLGLGTWSSTVTERHTGKVDPGIIVVDEAAGMLITMLFVPATAVAASTGFFVFRALDILKPWPARRLERLAGGWGVMADDAMAALYGNLVMRVLVAAAPGLFR